MGKFLYDEFTQTRVLFEEASDALSVNFKKLCFDGSESDLAVFRLPQFVAGKLGYPQSVKEFVRYERGTV